ncbi:MAG: SGNH/GDSL hydrolase family protein, partial [Planctomycetota bacterium]
MRAPRLIMGAAVLTAVAAGLLTAEMILRRLLPVDTRYYVYAPNLRQELHPSPQFLPGIEGTAVLRTNSDGIRGDEISPRHTYRILTVGASTSENLYLDQSETWAHRLQELLSRQSKGVHRVWIGNIGRPGRRTRANILQLEYLLPQHSEIDAILLLLGGTDLMRRLSEDVEYDPRAMDRPEERTRIMARAFWSYGGAPPATGIRGTAFWRLARRLRRATAEWRPASQNRDYDTTGSVFATRRAHRAAASGIRDELPDLTSSLGEYVRNLDTLTAHARAHSVRIIFMTHPNMYRADLPAAERRLLWMGNVGPYHEEPGHPYYSVRALAEGFAAYNRALLRFCEERG